MKKTFIIFATILLGGIGFVGCKKGEGDPAISLRSRAARLAGDWTIASGTQTSKDVTNNETTESKWDGGNITVTYTDASGTSAGTGTGTFTASFTKDGTWETVEKSTITFGSGAFTYSVTTDRTKSGTWNFSGKVGDSKNKSQIILRTLKETNVYPTKTDVEEYTGDDAPSEIWNLYELKNKELIAKWDGKTTMTSGSSTSTTTEMGEMTFTQ